MRVPRHPDASWLAGLPDGWVIVGDEFHCSADVLARMDAYNGTFPTSPSPGRVYRRDVNENRRRALASSHAWPSDQAWAEASKRAPEEWWVYVVRDETAAEAAEDRARNPLRARMDEGRRYQIHVPHRWVECSPCPHAPPPDLPPIRWRAP